VAGGRDMGEWREGGLGEEARRLKKSGWRAKGE